MVLWEEVTNNNPGQMELAERMVAIIRKRAEDTMKSLDLLKKYYEYQSGISFYQASANGESDFSSGEY